MPPHNAPYRIRDVRDLYARGTWAYALGKPAWSHPRYAECVTLAKQRKFNPWWIRNWSDCAAVLDGCWMNEKEGAYKADFFSLLRQFEGEFAGQPLTLVDWMRFDVMMPLFGWMRADGTRRFRRGHIEIPKKNGKTTISAGVVLLLTGFDDEPGAEVYTSAVDRKQASKMFRSAHEMLQRSKAIREKFQPIPSRYRIIHPSSASYYEALSADVASKEGLNIHGLVEDELHVYPDRAMHDTLKHGGAARRQPMFFAITTAGVYDPTSIGWEQHDYATRILQAINEAHNDWSFFAYMCGLSKDEEALFHEPAMAVKANPNIGISLKASEFADVVKEAQQKPSELSKVKRYRFNIWTSQVDAWLPQEKWDACRGDYTETDLEGLTCFGGLDASLSQDISALVLYFPKQGDMPKNRFLCRFWVPKGGVLRADEQYNGWYSMWIKSGALIETPGDTINQEFIREELNKLAAVHSIRTIGYDRAFAQKLASDLESDGFDVGPFGQSNAAMNEPTMDLERMILEQEIEHPNNPVMNWHFSNAQLHRDGGDRVRVVKNWGKAANKAKIRFKVDGIIALIEAIGTSMLDEIGIVESVDQLIR